MYPVMEKRQGGAGKSGGIQPPAMDEKIDRVTSNEMCTFLILNISSLQLILV